MGTQGVRLRRACFVWAAALALWGRGELAAAAEAALVAAEYSDRYHRPACKVAAKIHKDDRLAFATPEEALASGRVPCKKCDAPVASVRGPDR